MKNRENNEQAPLPCGELSFHKNNVRVIVCVCECVQQVEFFAYKWCGVSRWDGGIAGSEWKETSHEIGFIYNYSYEIVNLYNPSNHVFHKKKQRFCNRMMTFVYVFGGILCGLHKVHKTPRIPSILKIWASNVWHAVTWTFWPEAFYVWHSISYYAVNSHKIYLRTTHYKKTRSNYRYPKIAFYQGFLRFCPRGDIL